MVRVGGGGRGTFLFIQNACQQRLLKLSFFPVFSFYLRPLSSGMFNPLVYGLLLCLLAKTDPVSPSKRLDRRKKQKKTKLAPG